MNSYKNIQRIFVSSTFIDMHVERDFLTNFVAPLVNSKLRDTQVRIEFCDYRWGIDISECSDKEANLKIFNYCFSGIEFCKPIFIGIIGNRYGWVNSDHEIKEFVKSKLDHTISDSLSVTEYEIRHAVQLSEKKEIELIFLMREIDCDKELIKKSNYFEVDAQDKIFNLKEYIYSLGENARIINYESVFDSSCSRLLIKKRDDLLKVISDEILRVINDRIESGFYDVGSSTNHPDSSFLKKSYEVRKFKSSLTNRSNEYFTIDSCSDRNFIEFIVFILDACSELGCFFPVALEENDYMHFSLVHFIDYILFMLQEVDNSLGYFDYCINKNAFEDDEILLGVSKGYTLDVEAKSKELEKALSGRVIVIFLVNVNLMDLHDLDNLLKVFSVNDVNVKIVARSDLKDSNFYGKISSICSINLGLNKFIPLMVERFITYKLSNRSKKISEKVKEEILKIEFSKDIEWVEAVLNFFSDFDESDYKTINSLNVSKSYQVEKYQLDLLSDFLQQPCKNIFSINVKRFLDSLELNEYDSIESCIVMMASLPMGFSIRSFADFHKGDCRYIYDVFEKRFSNVFVSSYSGYLTFKSGYKKELLNIASKIPEERVTANLAIVGQYLKFLPIIEPIKKTNILYFSFQTGIIDLLGDYFYNRKITLVCYEIELAIRGFYISQAAFERLFYINFESFLFEMNRSSCRWLIPYFVKVLISDSVFSNLLPERGSSRFGYITEFIVGNITDCSYGVWDELSLYLLKKHCPLAAAVSLRDIELPQEWSFVKNI